MATYYALFAVQPSYPVVSVPYVDAFGTGKRNTVIPLPLPLSLPLLLLAVVVVLVIKDYECVQL